MEAIRTKEIEEFVLSLISNLFEKKINKLKLNQSIDH